jgi:dolichol-phosphate mannosyltransferase
LIFFALLFVLKLVWASRVGLGDDEAYYWEWSRHLDWSYFDHPGMVAWLIRLATEVLGPTELAVRFFAVTCHVLSGMMIADLTLRLSGPRAAWAAALLYVTMPGIAIGSFMMVPDAPMSLFWIGAVWYYCAFLDRDIGGGEISLSWLKWIGLGLIVGLGLLSKYTMVLLAFGWLLWFSWRRLIVLRRPQVWLALLIASLLCLPILLWNWSLGWPSFAFHLHDRQTGGGGASIDRWLQFWVSQLVAAGPVLLGIVLWMWSSWIGKSDRDPIDRRYQAFFALLSLPTFLLFASQSLFAEFKPHWPLPAYATMIPVLAPVVLRLLFETSTAARFFVWSFGVGFVLILNLAFHAATAAPVIPRIYAIFGGSPETWQPQFDPTNDLYGWPEVVSRIEQIRQEPRLKDRGVFLASYRYQLTSQLAFASQERVWRIFPTRDQYRIWQSRWAEASSPVGQSAIFVVDQRFRREPNEKSQFDSCEPEERLETRRAGQLARIFSIWVCHGFRGLQD